MTLEPAVVFGLMSIVSIEVVEDDMDGGASMAATMSFRNSTRRRFGFTLSRVQNWEQGYRRHERPARVLLKIIDKSPDVVERGARGRLILSAHANGK
jgi:hypothetical protein